MALKENGRSRFYGEECLLHGRSLVLQMRKQSK